MGIDLSPSFSGNLDTIKLKLDISTRNESSEEKVTKNKIAGDWCVQGNSPRLIILGAHHLSAFHYNAHEKRPHSACSLLFILLLLYLKIGDLSRSKQLTSAWGEAGVDQQSSSECSGFVVTKRTAPWRCQETMSDLYKRDFLVFFRKRKSDMICLFQNRGISIGDDMTCPSQ